ncbi:MAG: phage terminase large subunit family protein [Sphingomonas sp.]|nr:terminase gpA endonuclease subunit [Sphingomonas sp.]MDX3885996.1 phage terminase large subunit family protein [Sphingomonas sp.]
MLPQTVRTSIPSFESGGSILAGAACLFRPKSRQTVSEWAVEHRAFDIETAPWQAEIMDALGDPETSEVGLMGPAQQGKSEIGLAWIGWSIDHDPADMLVCQPDKSLAQDFVVRRIDPMIDSTGAVKAQLLPAANANNIFLKRFRAMLLTSIWPVAGQFRARPVPRGWLDDFDQIDADIEGQGSAIGLLDSRAENFEGRDTKFISSSPARQKGKADIEAFVETGTDERLLPVCPSCGDRFEPDMTRDLRFERGSLDEAERTAHVVCPVNGCILPPSARRQLLQSLVSLPNRGFVATYPERGKRRRTFRVDGLLGFKSWPQRARQWRDAEIAWETRQDESELRSFWNTKAGKNYRSIHAGEKPIETSDLAERREKGFFLGVVPRGPVFTVVVVDAQHDRFDCAQIGFGEGLESWVIDRWSIDVLDDGLTPLAPFKYREHWQVLLPLFNRRLPLADGSGLAPPPLTVAIDTGGGGDAGDGATEHAKQFWYAARAIGVHPTRLTLIKGGKNPGADLMPRAKFADQKLKGGAKRNSPQLWMPNVHRLKLIIDARLRRTKPGPGYIHLPGGRVGGGQLPPSVIEENTGRLTDRHLEEITAEQLDGGKWKKIRPRNETWDLLVYAYAAILRPPFAQSRPHMRWVPEAFRIGEQVTLPLGGTDPEAMAAVDIPAPAAPALTPPNAPVRAPVTKRPSPPARNVKLPVRGKSWLNRRK